MLYLSLLAHARRHGADRHRLPDPPARRDRRRERDAARRPCRKPGRSGSPHDAPRPRAKSGCWSIPGRASRKSSAPCPPRRRAGRGEGVPVLRRLDGGRDRDAAEDAITALRHNAETFSLEIDLPHGRLIEASGKTIGGYAVVRFVALEGLRDAEAEIAAGRSLARARSRRCRTCSTRADPDLAARRTAGHSAGSTTPMLPRWTQRKLSTGPGTAGGVPGGAGSPDGSPRGCPGNGPSSPTSSRPWSRPTAAISRWWKPPGRSARRALPSTCRRPSRSAWSCARPSTASPRPSTNWPRRSPASTTRRASPITTPPSSGCSI